MTDVSGVCIVVSGVSKELIMRTSLRALVWVAGSVASFVGCVLAVGAGSAGGGAGGGAGSSGGGWNSVTDDRVSMEKHLAIKHVAGKPLEMETRNGSIEIVEATPVDGVMPTDVEVHVVVRAATQGRLDSMKIHTSRESDGTLKVWDEWDGSDSKDTCDFVVTVPDVSRIVAKTQNGQIKIKGLNGEASLKTSNGQVGVHGYRGNLKAETTNGQIELVDVHAGAVRTQNGQVHITVADGATGPISAQTSNGQMSVKVGSEFGGVIEASVSNGSVRNSLNRGTTKSEGKKKQTITLGNGPTITLSTKNGQIEIGPK
jgi:hypothetical protein